MKHSKKEKTPKGYSKGKNRDMMKRLGPIMIEDILTEVEPFSKYDVSIREMIIRTDPTNESSPIIKKRFKPMDNPATVLEVLKGILVIKEGVVGNNVTTGPLQYQYWRGCLEGTALSKFNEFAIAVGTETSAHLITVEQRLVTFFAPREVLSQQARYIRYHMRKPYGVTTRQYVGAVQTLNEKQAELPPGFVVTQKVPDMDIMDILASKSPKSHKELMTTHGFDPQTATIEEFVEISERAETKDGLYRSKKTRFESDDDSSNDERPSKKAKKKASKKPSYNNKSRYYCTEHGPNPTHDSGDCKVLLNRKPGEKSDWKKKDHSAGKYKDYQSKYKKKHQELNLLQAETKKEKAKWTKAYKKLKSKEVAESDASEDEASNEDQPRRNKPTFTQKEHPKDDSDDSSSSSSSSSSSDSDSS
jgi:hypothetical protein